MVILILLFIIILFNVIIRFPKFCLSFQSAKNVLLDTDVMWRSRTKSFMSVIVV